MLIKNTLLDCRCNVIWGPAMWVTDTLMNKMSYNLVGRQPVVIQGGYYHVTLAYTCTSSLMSCHSPTHNVSCSHAELLGVACTCCSLFLEYCLCFSLPSEPRLKHQAPVSWLSQAESGASVCMLHSTLWGPSWALLKLTSYVSFLLETELPKAENVLLLCVSLAVTVPVT